MPVRKKPTRTSSTPGLDTMMSGLLLSWLKSNAITPLDVQAIKDAKDHIFRGWNRLDPDKPETINRFGVRLKLEQDGLRRDGVHISDQDVKEHYLLQVYKSRAFSNEIIRTFQQLAPEDQDWEATTTYFNDAMKDME